MKRYRWATKRSNVYHDMFHLTEKCNTDALKAFWESDTPPEGRRLCMHCHFQALQEDGNKS